MNLTEDQILALAPDDASKKSGKDLANPAKWVSKGANETAMTGLPAMTMEMPSSFLIWGSLYLPVHPINSLTSWQQH